MPDTFLSDRPYWLYTARKYVGTKEIKGPKHNSQILKWWSAIRAPFTDDETPWCAAYVGGILEECGIRSTRSAVALSYENWGFEIMSPSVGSIAVKKRYNWQGKLVGGHVGFVMGQDKSGNLIILGGNQNDSVSYAAYKQSDFHTFRWPNSVPFITAVLPLVDNASDFEVKEA